MTDVADDTAATIQNVVRSTVPLLGAIGMEIVEASPGVVRTRLPFRPENGNHIGTVYAGVLFSFLEASGGALVLMAFDVSRWIPVIVEGTIRYQRPVTGPIECALSLSPDERDAVHGALDADPKHRWMLTAAATDPGGSAVCEADLVYRFRAIG